MSNPFNDKIVIKPWGYESLLFANADVELWYLHLNKHQQTSTHCHPNKLTGLIVIDGLADVSFFNNVVRLKPLDKVMIRRGLFHSTRCVSESGLDLLEIESPPDKSDLVRLADNYGRAGQPYESEEHHRVDLSKVKLEEFDKQYCLGSCVLMLTKSVATMMNDPLNLIVVLSGALKSNEKSVLGAGDVVVVQTFDKLSRAFSNDNLEALVISRQNNG